MYPNIFDMEHDLFILDSILSKCFVRSLELTLNMILCYFEVNFEPWNDEYSSSFAPGPHQGPFSGPLDSTPLNSRLVLALLLIQQ